MDDITSQVETLIQKGDTEEKSAIKIKRLNTILKLLCDQKQCDDDEKQKAQAKMVKADEQLGIHKKAITDDKGQEGGSPEKTEEKDKTKMVTGTKEVPQGEKVQHGILKKKEEKEPT